MSWYLAGLRKYAAFGGRARRKEYWLYTLFHVLAALIVSAIATACVIIGVATEVGAPWMWVLPSVLLVLGYSFGTLVPTLAVLVRRLHDTGQPVWWLFLMLLPAGLGGIVFLVFALLPGDPHANKYGPAPKPPYGPVPDLGPRPPVHVHPG